MMTRKIDIVILSLTKNDSIRKMTEECIDSLLRSEDPSEVEFEILVLESNRSLAPFAYANTKTIYPAQTFGYNKYLNLAVKRTQNPFICFCNNDLKFEQGWASRILEVFDSHPEILSCSPIDPWLHQHYDYDRAAEYVLGYEKMKHMTGWCFMVKREIFARIGLFDEKFLFWYCDDDYINTIKEHQIKHALVTKSKVWHLSGKTISSDATADQKRRDYKIEQWFYFDYKWHHRSRAIMFLKRIKYLLGGYRGI